MNQLPKFLVLAGTGAAVGALLGYLGQCAGGS